MRANKGARWTRSLTGDRGRREHCQRGEGSSLVILGPRRADQTTDSCNSQEYPLCRISEGHFYSLLKFPLSNCLDRNFQSITGVPDAGAKEFAFGGMNQRMGGENFCQGRQRAAGGQEKGS